MYLYVYENAYVYVHTNNIHVYEYVQYTCKYVNENVYTNTTYM